MDLRSICEPQSLCRADGNAGPIPLVFALSRYAHGPRRTMAAIAAAVMASTIFLSGSRGGMVAFAVEMAVLVSILVRQRKSKQLALALGAFLDISVGLLAWLGAGQSP